MTGYVRITFEIGECKQHNDNNQNVQTGPNFTMLRLFITPESVDCQQQDDQSRNESENCVLDVIGNRRSGLGVEKLVYQGVGRNLTENIVHINRTKSEVKNTEIKNNGNK